jgi:hypothetical protein
MQSVVGEKKWKWITLQEHGLLNNSVRNLIVITTAPILAMQMLLEVKLAYLVI